MEGRTTNAFDLHGPAGRGISSGAVLCGDFSTRGNCWMIALLHCFVGGSDMASRRSRADV